MTPEQLAYVRRMLGTYSGSLDNTLLESLYQDAVATEVTNAVNGTVALAFYQLMINAVTLTNFRQGETQENEAIIFDRLKAMYERWYNLAGFATPVPIFTMSSIVMGYIDFPTDEELYA